MNYNGQKKRPSYEDQIIKTGCSGLFSPETCLTAAEVKMYHPINPNEWWPAG
jgi:hypothetical protein